jgi:hypothetical protein
MGSIVDFGNISKQNNFASFPKSDPLDSVLGKKIIIVNAEIMEYTGKRGASKLAIIRTENGEVFRSSGKIILSQLQDQIIPLLKEGNKVACKPVRKTFNNGNRGMVFEGAE